MPEYVKEKPLSERILLQVKKIMLASPNERFGEEVRELANLVYASAFRDALDVMKMGKATEDNLMAFRAIRKTILVDFLKEVAENVDRETQEPWKAGTPTNTNEG